MNETIQDIESLCRALWELHQRAPHDLCGEVRTYHLKRIRRAFFAAGKLFPGTMAHVTQGEKIENKTNGT